MNKVENSIREILKGINPGTADIGADDNLLRMELLDSFDIINLIGKIEEVFDIEISGTEVIAENFESVGSIQRLVESKISA